MHGDQRGTRRAKAWVDGDDMVLFGIATGAESDGGGVFVVRPASDWKGKRGKLGMGGKERKTN
jgi:hypothetical protein